MGLYRQLVTRRLGPAELGRERAVQLARIRACRGRPVLALAGTLTGGNGALGSEDLLLVEDLLEDLPAGPLDLVLQSPGSSLEVVEELERRLRRRHGPLAVLVPRRVASPTCLLALTAEELWMSAVASLAPVVPVVGTKRGAFPADVVQESAREGTGGDPIEARLADDALTLVRTWLCEGLVRRGLDPAAASAAAAALASSRRFGLATRPLPPEHLMGLGIPISRTEDRPDLAEALAHWDVLCQLTLSGGMVRVAETPEAQHQRAQPGTGMVVSPSQIAAGGAPSQSARPAAGAAVSPSQTAPAPPRVAVLEVRCDCGVVSRVQASLGAPAPLQEGHWAFPRDDVFLCPECMRRRDLGAVRRKLQEQTGLSIIA